MYRTHFCYADGCVVKHVISSVCFYLNILPILLPKHFYMHFFPSNIHNLSNLFTNFCNLLSDRTVRDAFKRTECINYVYEYTA